MPISVNGANGITFADGSIQNTGASGFGFKNRIINGAMVIDQRNNGSSITNPNTGWPVDRFGVAQYISDTTTQRSTTAPAGFTNSLLVTNGTGTAIPNQAYTYTIGQAIEGYNTADLGFGTANAKTVTVSFWVRSSVSGAYSMTLCNAAGATNLGATRAYVATYTISAANTWQRITITVPGDTTGTWNGASSAAGLTLLWNLGSGSNYNTTSANAWAGGNYFKTSGDTTFNTTTGATFYLTGVQLEVGSTATTFDYRSFTTELQLCQRYYYTNPGVNGGIVYMPVIGDGYRQMLYTWPVTMRTSPTVTAAYSGGSNQGTQYNTPYSSNVYLNAGNNTSVYYLVSINAAAEL